VTKNEVGERNALVLDNCRTCAHILPMDNGATPACRHGPTCNYSSTVFCRHAPTYAYYWDTYMATAIEIASAGPCRHYQKGGEL